MAHQLDGDLFTVQLHTGILAETTRRLQNTRDALAEAIDLLEFDDFRGSRVDALRKVLETGEPLLVELKNDGPIPLFILDGDKK